MVILHKKCLTFCFHHHICCNFFSGLVWIIISWFLLSSSFLSNLFLVWLVVLGLRRVNLNLIMGNMRIQENSNTLLPDPTNRRILRGFSSSNTSPFKYLKKKLVTTFGSVLFPSFGLINDIKGKI